jgi:hypothetical protein
MLARFTDNPIARTEWTYLSRQENVRWRLTYLLLFVLALIAAITPLWLYMDLFQSAALLIMAVIIYLAHIIVGMRTLLLASDSIPRERRCGTWDNLILTGVDARQIMWGKWWAVVRHVWKDHALMALPRLGLAFGLAQYLYVMPLDIPYVVSSYLRCPLIVPFCYASRSGPPTLNPELWTVLIAIGAAVLYSVFEVGLLSALGLFSALLAQKWMLIFAVSGRIIITLLAVVLLVLVGNIRLEGLIELHCGLSATIDCSWDEQHKLIVPSYTPENADEFGFASRTLRRIRDTLQVAVSPFIEGGNLMVANIMRPPANVASFGDSLIWVNGEWIVLYPTNLLFVLRNLVAALLGLVLYALIIGGILRLVQAAVVRQA